MARRSAGFVDQHIEKVAVGVGALILISAVWYAFLSDRFAVNGLKPAALCKTVGEEAERTAQRIRNAKPAADKPSEKQRAKDAILADWFGPTAKGLIALAGVESPVWRTQPFGPRFLSTMETSAAGRHDLARIVAPILPVVTSGRTGFDLSGDKPELDAYDGKPVKGSGTASVRNWVAVVAQIDLIQQDINFKSENYPPGSFPFVVQVHLQRLDETERWRGWQDVETYLPFKMPKRPELWDSQTRRFNLDGPAAFRNLVLRQQAYLARPTLPVRVSGDRIRYPAVPYFLDPPDPKKDDAGKRVRRWMQSAEYAYEGKREFKDAADPDAAFVLARGVVGTPAARQRELDKARKLLAKVNRKFRKDPNRRDLVEMSVRPPTRLMPIAAYDLDAEPGHRYRYRLRYEILNRFAGNGGELRDPTDAEKLTLFSAWSPVSRPVEIRSNIRFFLTKANARRGEVTVTVHKKLRTGWKTAEFRVKVGDKIGGRRSKGRDRGDYSTDAFCVDIDFDRKVNGKSDVVLVYVDRNDGRVRELYLSSGKKASDKLARR